MLTRLSLTALFLTVSLSLASATAAGEPSWPRFHGADSYNKSPDTGLLKKWPEGGPKLLWTVKGIGGGYSTVTIGNGTIYTTGSIDKKAIVTSMDLDGNVKWRYDNGPSWVRSYPGSRAIPTIDGERLYYQSGHGQLVCLEAKTGKKIWDTNTFKAFDGRKTYWAFTESVLIDGNNVIVCPSGDKASVVALNKMTGQLVWKAKDVDGANGYASPVVVEYGGLRIVLTMNGKAFIAVNADGGELLCTFPWPTKHGVNALTPLHHDGCVFISSGYGAGSKLLKLKVQGKTASVEEVWSSSDLSNHHGGVMLIDGFLYGAASKWVCLDWKTGKTQWIAEGVGKGSATFADGMLYTLSEKKKVGLSRPTPKGHELISQFEIPQQGKGPSWAHPVVCGGRLYIRYDDFLHAYDVKAN